MKSTREKILYTLLTYPDSTINDLAEAVGINGISIRHHLTSLEAEDLVVSAEERHGVGRPRLIYSLTDKGLEKFPSGYIRLIRRIIAALRVKIPSSEVKAIFGEIGSQMAKTYRDALEGKNLEDRLDLLKKAMLDEGFIIEYEQNEDAYSVILLSCPYNQIIADNQELCSLDHHLISEFLSVPVEKKSCILNGDDNCTYHIPINKGELI
jgi:predicted ArsR family transcriptional regulator